MRKLNICTFTVGRSDIGLLSNILERLQHSSKFNSVIFVGSGHTSKTFGSTFKEIKNYRLKNISYSKESLSKNILKNIISNIRFAEKSLTKKFDACIILGDRYEMMAISLACINLDLPILHLCGGSYTEGSLDNIYRYNISRMSLAHFVETKYHKDNLIKNNIKKNIFTIGAPSLEDFNKNLLQKNEVEKKLKLKFVKEKKILVCCFHPNTLLSVNRNAQDLIKFLEFLKKIDQNVIFTYPNADKGFAEYINILRKFSKSNNFHLIKNLGKKLYFSILSFSDVMIGHSSSGIIESASFKIPVINLGERQKNRIASKNIVNSNFDNIENNYNYITSIKFNTRLKNIKNIYYKKNTSKLFVNIIYKLLNKYK